MSHLQTTITALSNQFARAVTEALMASLAQTVPVLDPPSRAGAAPKGAKAPAPKVQPKKTAPAKAQTKPTRGSAGAKKVSILDRLPTPRPAPKAAPQAKAKAKAKATSPMGSTASGTQPVLLASLGSPQVQERLSAILAALADGPLYSEDLRRLVNLPRPELVKPLLLGLKTRKITKSGDRRKTVYQLV